MLWITAVLIAAVAAAAGLVLVKRRRPRKSLISSRVARKLVKANPYTVSVAVLNGDTGGRETTALATCSFLRSSGRIYREKKHLYLAMDKPKSAGRSATDRSGELVSLSFLHRGVPHSVTCRWMGKTRLKPEMAERLDTPCKSAYKVRPVSRLRREEKRSFLRYLVATNGGGTAATTPYISFEAHLGKADRSVVEDRTTEIVDLGCTDLNGSNQSRVSAAAVINQLRAYMLIRPPEDRKVQVQKLVRRRTLADRLRTHLRHEGCIVNLLDLDGSGSADTMRIQPPVSGESRITGRRLLETEDRILIHFDRGGKHYQMEAEVVGSDLDSVSIRPTGQICEDAGLEVSVMDFSAGGALIQGSRRLIEFLLGRKLTTDEMSNDSPARGEILKSLKRQLVKLTFQPKLNFPEIGKRFQPSVPAKICVLAQIVRSQFVRYKGREVLQHGVKFVYDGHPDADAEDVFSWRQIKEGHGNCHFNEIHAKIGSLSGFLDRESRDKGLSGVTQEISDNRVAFVVEKGAGSAASRKRANS